MLLNIQLTNASFVYNFNIQKKKKKYFKDFMDGVAINFNHLENFHA